MLCYQEKGALIRSTDTGADEDSADSLLKKQEAIMSDVEAFQTTIDTLHDQADACKVVSDSVFVYTLCNVLYFPFIEVYCSAVLLASV